MCNIRDRVSLCLIESNQFTRVTETVIAALRFVVENSQHKKTADDRDDKWKIPLCPAALAAQYKV